MKAANEGAGGAELVEQHGVESWALTGRWSTEAGGLDRDGRDGSSRAGRAGTPGGRRDGGGLGRNAVEGEGLAWGDGRADGGVELALPAKWARRGPGAAG